MQTGRDSVLSTSANELAFAGSIFESTMAHLPGHEPLRSLQLTYMIRA